MSRPPFTAWHQPVIKAGVNGPEEQPLGDWTNSWVEARNVLIQMGLAIYVFGILTIAPIVTIKMEITYGK